MRHGKAGFKLGRVTAHRWALFRNLLVALFRHERIMTTEAKAKAVRGLADHMVTLAKRDDLHARRQVLSMVPDAVVVKKLFDTIAARFSERHGGYTRIMKAGLRPGDRAQMVVLELVDRPEEPKEKGKKDAKAEKAPKEDKKAGKGRGLRGRSQGPAQEGGCRGGVVVVCGLSFCCVPFCCLPFRCLPFSSLSSVEMRGPRNGPRTPPVRGLPLRRLFQVFLEQVQGAAPGVLGGRLVVDVGPLVVEEARGPRPDRCGSRPSCPPS